MPQYAPKDPLLLRIMSVLPKQIGCCFLFVWAIVLIPLIPLFLWQQSYRRSFLAKSLAKQGRLLSWGDFLARTMQSTGSVIIEVGNKRKSRFWWAAERILADAPMEPPKFSELNIIAYGGATYHPFARWCYENYLVLEGGKALLAYPVEANFETFPFEFNYDEEMKNRFPNQDVVIVTFYDARYA